MSDPRWERLLTEGVRCSSCAQFHRGIFDIGFLAPYHWDGQSTPEDPSAIADHDNFLTSDLCVIKDKYFFVRCLLELPVIDASDQRFAFGIWASLSKQNFQTYCEHYNDDDQVKLGSWFGWFSTQLKGYPDTLSLKCKVHPQNERCRPLIELGPTEHPLGIEQRDGITIERLFKLYKLYGHDFGE